MSDELDDELDEAAPYLGFAEVGSLGAVLVYTCSTCGAEELVDEIDHALAQPDTQRLLEAGPCPHCGGTREIGMHDLADRLNEFLGAYRDAVASLLMVKERVPAAAPLVDQKLAEIEASVEQLRRSVRGEESGA